MNPLLVFLGGGAGALARYLLSSAVQRWIGAAAPLGTLTVNVLGCLVAGMFVAHWEARVEASHDLRLFVAVGVLGGFTTFSALGADTLALVRDGRNGLALVYVLANLLLGLGAVALGWAVAR